MQRACSKTRFCKQSPLYFRGEVTPKQIQIARSSFLFTTSAARWLPCVDKLLSWGGGGDAEATWFGFLLAVLVQIAF